MKKAIELLGQARHQLGDIVGATILDASRKSAVKNYIDKALSILQAPRWETPEQREKRTGEPLPDDWAVYERYETNDGERQWHCESYDYAKRNSKKRKKEPKFVVCATEFGPPPADWEPEKE
jgi:hypothetical protein